MLLDHARRHGQTVDLNCLTREGKTVLDCLGFHTAAFQSRYSQNITQSYSELVERETLCLYEMLRESGTATATEVLGLTLTYRYQSLRRAGC